MANKKTERETAYLTKRALVRAVNKGTRGLAQQEMDLMGYVTRAEDGWVVRIDKEGNRTRISKIDHGPIPDKIILD
jgi:hypothetical protein